MSSLFLSRGGGLFWLFIFAILTSVSGDNPQVRESGHTQSQSQHRRSAFPPPALPSEERAILKTVPAHAATPRRSASPRPRPPLSQPLQQFLNASLAISAQAQAEGVGTGAGTGAGTGGGGGGLRLQDLQALAAEFAKVQCGAKHTTLNLQACTDSCKLVLTLPPTAAPAGISMFIYCSLNTLHPSCLSD